MIKKILLCLLISLFFSTPVCAEYYIATAYDLSPQSCGKHRNDPSYGITASGFNLKGHTWQTARTVSADLSIHKLGTKLYVEFPTKYSHMNGIYTVRDTGGGVHGNHLDIFMGEYSYNEAINFGRQQIYVKKI